LREEAPTTQTCPECYSEIDARARTCPHCQKKLARNGALYGFNLLIGTFSLLLLLGGACSSKLELIVIGVVILLIAYQFRQ
jgi:hypothetical protein